MANTRLSTVPEDRLKALVDAANQDPAAFKKVSRAVTVCQGGFLNATYIRDRNPVMIDEPPQLLGTDTTPNPSEHVLAALGACLSVGYMANATAMGIAVEELRLELEGDIDISPVWGVRRETPPDQVAGFTEIRVKAHIKADMTPEQERELHERTLRWSPVANTLRNPVRVVAELNP
ncbi:MAG: OsmC family protein [Firmicutes bacterium]|nr:OsmC family protein [Alicyclobacillaceae bacterium]MCL6496281.1 OsmC family protein [Bacillota bacterium]